MNTLNYDSNSYLAIEFLENIGNHTPSELEIQKVGKLLAFAFKSKDLSFHDSLSEIEADYLYWFACGKSNDEIAHILPEKSGDVKGLGKKIKQKLSCSTLAEAIFKGLKDTEQDSILERKVCAA